MGKSYCGKRYGLIEYATGFLIAGIAGYFASSIIYGIIIVNIVVAIISGIFGSRAYVDYLIQRRKKEFTLEFCDYLDAISSSLSCGKNSYEAFIIANEDMQGLYAKDLPICIESQRVSNGLRSGRSIDELLQSMSERTKSEDVAIFADIFSICNVAGGNLKQTVNDAKATIIEKINIENEIKTSLASPKNELNIMATMPIIITASLNLLGDAVGGGNTFFINTVAVCIFVFAYYLGNKIVQIEV